jgi:hypothetical protein
MPPIKLNSQHKVPGPGASNSHPYEFVWKYGGNEVILTGNFDNWQKTIIMKMDNTDSQTFRVTLMLEPTQTWYYKFVVDGIWRCSLEFPTETDNAGNVNNVVYPVKSLPIQKNREANGVPSAVTQVSRTLRS